MVRFLGPCTVCMRVFDYSHNKINNIINNMTFLTVRSQNDYGLDVMGWMSFKMVVAKSEVYSALLTGDLHYLSMFQ